MMRLWWGLLQQSLEGRPSSKALGRASAIAESNRAWLGV
jgi:hypothetical protein